jgi:hypothetical protein
MYLGVVNVMWSAIAKPEGERSSSSWSKAAMLALLVI